MAPPSRCLSKSCALTLWTLESIFTSVEHSRRQRRHPIGCCALSKLSRRPPETSRQRLPEPLSAPGLRPTLKTTASGLQRGLQRLPVQCRPPVARAPRGACGGAAQPPRWQLLERGHHDNSSAEQFAPPQHQPHHQRDGHVSPLTTAKPGRPVRSLFDSDTTLTEDYHRLRKPTVLPSSEHKPPPQSQSSASVSFV